MTEMALPSPRKLDRPDQASEDSRVDFTDAGARDVDVSHIDALTIGVEEEFLLLHPESGSVVACAAEVIEAMPSDLRAHVRQELLATQIEIATPVCRDLTQLRHWLARLRRAVAEAAERAGARLAAAGTGPLHYPGTPPLARNDRYAQMAREFGALVEVQGLCACHVHVGIKDRDLAAGVSNHLRQWLPVLHALSVNSPYADGRDTGYASWRSILWTRWPTSGPAPWLRSAEHNDETVAELITSGAMLDPQMVYWYARLSPRYPTIEVRIGDVFPTVDDTVLAAAITRALVRTAVDEVRRGRSAPHIDDWQLQAAHWRAARDGVDGAVFDLEAGGIRPGWELVDRLVDRVRPALEELGDLAMVQTLVARTRASGSGAARQRAVFAASSDLRAVADFLARQTLSGLD
jgi:glutamate---cysteine ligase / carboxylate-amine ligase